MANSVKQSRLLSMRPQSIVAVTIANLIVLISFVPPKTAAQTTKNTSASMLTLKARHIEESGDLNGADILYQRALAEAERTNSKIDTIEILSRLVRLRIDNHKLNQTEPLVHSAIDIVTSLRGTPAYDPEMTVWMDDMADAFYSRGERSQKANLKELCLQRYLDLKLTIADHFDPQLMGRANILTSYLANQGHYTEGVLYVEKTLAYIRRTRPQDIEANAIVYYVLSNAYIAANKLSEAKAALAQCIQLKEAHGKNVVWEGIIKIHLGTIEFEEGNTTAARENYKQAIKLHEESLGRASMYTGWDYAALGILEQRSGNIPVATQLFRTSLDSFDRCGTLPISVNNPLHPEAPIYSGRAICLEHLAQVAAKQGNLSAAKAMQAKAKLIRGQIPYWDCKNPDPDGFYLLSGFLPFSLELIPTHSSASL